MAAPAAAAAKEAARQALNRVGQGGGDEQREAGRRRTRMLLQAAIAIPVIIVLLFCVVLVSVFSAVSSEAAQRPGTAYPPRSGIPRVYWDMYVAAATHYQVNPYLLASIHYQETRFSTAPSSTGGTNPNGCCAGPMQFNVEIGGWTAYQNAFRRIAAARPRPPEYYPSDRYRLPSCRSVPVDTGCVYDDFDAIAGAALKLHEDEATPSLGSKGTHNALCAYIGSCGEVDACTHSENQYCEVLPRAQKWERLGREAEAKAAARLGLVASTPLRERIVKIAIGQLGERESAGNCNPYGPCEEWCAMFSTWVWENAGIHIRAAMSREGLSPYYVPYLETYAKRHGLWHSSPEPGDMIIFDEHVGLVKGLLSGGQISEIGGNQGDAVREAVGLPDDLGEGTAYGYLSPPENGHV